MSVVASAAVAVLTASTQVILAAGNRRHERRLAIEERAWPDRSSMLRHAMGYALHLQRLIDDFSGDVDLDTLVPSLRESRSELEGRLAPSVMLYGSPTTRRNLSGVRMQLRGLRLDDEAGWRQLSAARRRKAIAVDDQRWEDAATARDEEVQQLASLGFSQYGEALRQALDELTESLRVDLWEPVVARRRKPRQR